MTSKIAAWIDSKIVCRTCLEFSCTSSCLLSSPAGPTTVGGVLALTTGRRNKAIRRLSFHSSHRVTTAVNCARSGHMNASPSLSTSFNKSLKSENGRRFCFSCSLPSSSAPFAPAAPSSPAAAATGTGADANNSLAAVNQTW